MKGRKFNSLMPRYNENWSAKILGMEINHSAGPDLIDDEKAIEIKFRLLHHDRYTYKGWTALGYQLDYEREYHEIYWGFGFYKINKEVSEIKSREEINEEIILSRELYIVKWDWMNQFPLHHQAGKTESSEWDHYLIYPKFRLLPKIIYECDLESGKIFFTQGVNPKKFDINTKSL